LREAYRTLDRQIAMRSGMVEDLDTDDGHAPGASPSSPANGRQKPALGLDEVGDRMRAEGARRDEFPTGYFETKGGTMLGLRVVSFTTGMGDAGGDALLARVEGLVAEMSPPSYDPAMKVGFAGDIPNAAAEKESIVAQAAWASGIALVLIAAGAVWFFGSGWSLLIIAFPAVLGVGAAYAFAYARFGYVNTTGMFLGAIILGNGINYPIVLLARYREFRARGLGSAAARRQAVENALRAELVGACVASIAYGSLTVTRFRGFNQFGWIGFVGMLLVWVSMIPCVPALIVLVERVGSLHGARESGRLLRGIGAVSERAPRLVLAVAVALAAAAAWEAPSFLRDPWEYNFDRLGSRGSKRDGAGEWSNKADAVFGGKANVAGALMLADAAEQVPLIKRQILANDAADPQGSLIAEIATVHDFLPGTAAEQVDKLAVLARVRERLTPAVLGLLPEDERARVSELTPPEGLRVLGPVDLPALLRRRFEENDGRVGTVFYVKYRNDVSLSDGHNLLRIAKSTDNVRLPGGTVVQTASRATVFAEMIRSMDRDGPWATAASFLGVTTVVLMATRSVRGAFAVVASLLFGVVWLVGGAALLGEKLNYVNFVALPITFGIGCEYPFNVYDRSRLMGGDVTGALGRVGGAVALCSYTTVVGYGSLVFADFQALQSFGRLAVSGEIACLTASLFVLPAILHWIGARTAYAG
jgi:hypothetical protein